MDHDVRQTKSGNLGRHMNKRCKRVRRDVVCRLDWIVAERVVIRREHVARVSIFKFPVYRLQWVALGTRADPRFVALFTWVEYGIVRVNWHGRMQYVWRVLGTRRPLLS